MNEYKKLFYDAKRIIEKKYRILALPFNRSFVGVFLYRTERMLFKIFGKYYPFVRYPLLPLFS